MERELVDRLDALYQHDRRGYDAIMAVLRSVVRSTPGRRRMTMGSNRRISRLSS